MFRGPSSYPRGVVLGEGCEAWGQGAGDVARAGVSAPRFNSLGMPLIRGGKQRSSYTAHPPTVHYPFSGTPTAHRHVVIIAVSDRSSFLHSL